MAEMHCAMNYQSFSVDQQKRLAASLTKFLCMYRHLTDSYIIEFFSERLWEKLPLSWQEALGDLSSSQLADFLDGLSRGGGRSVWPLSLLAFRATAQALSFPRIPHMETNLNIPMDKSGKAKPAEFLKNCSQSSMLSHIFRKHVKPKKQHEIRHLGRVAKRLCDYSGCWNVVDIGSGQGHLSRYLSFGLGLSVTGVEADRVLVSMATKFDEQLLYTLKKENLRNVKEGRAASSFQFQLPQSLPRHVTGWLNPRGSWEDLLMFLQPQIHTDQHKSSSPLKAVQDASQSYGQPHICRFCDVAKAERDLNTSGDAQGHSNNHYSCMKEKTNSWQVDSSESTTLTDYSQLPFCCDTNQKLLCAENKCNEDFILTGLHACGDLSATLIRHFVHCPRAVGITSVACCYMKLTTHENLTPPGIYAPSNVREEKLEDAVMDIMVGYPMSCWVKNLPGHELSYKAREAACHAKEDYIQRLRQDSTILKVHCYRAVLETFIRKVDPSLKRAGIQTVKKGHELPFTDYARVGLKRLGLPADLPLDLLAVEDMLAQQGKVVAYFCLVMLLAPVVETLVLLDRILYLQQEGIECSLLPLFDPHFSPRNLVLVACKTKNIPES
ncbi:protein RRNAD1 isoform X1 [Polypterus senegalus]|nr:protein RRNAD1 isoform X1 [Polypterus senegalus]XP_039606897.1 protein RRNAD1 isoform X1 [Polypterus senegalus]